MMASPAAKGRARTLAGWLALAAAPTFALMSLIAANDMTAPALCMSGSGVLSVDGMAAMYLLMSLFYLPPWLKLLGARGHISPTEGD